MKPSNRSGRLNDKGITLIELIIVSAIVAILAVALGFSYRGWMGAYKIERQVKQLYSDLMDARVRAMQTNRNYFMDISTDGRYYRISQDDSNGVTKLDGDGIFQAQATWATIQGTDPASWGAANATKDTTVTALSRRLDLRNSPPAGYSGFNSPTAAGLLTGYLFDTPMSPWDFRLGFNKQGIVRNMTFSGTNIASANTFNAWYPAVPWTGPDVSICIFSDYDNNGISDYNPDYDCINIMETRILLGKLTAQNTAGGYCVPSNCISK